MSVWGNYRIHEHRHSEKVAVGGVGTIAALANTKVRKNSHFGVRQAEQIFRRCREIGLKCLIIVI